MLSDSIKVSATNEQLSCNIGDEAVVLNLQNSQYFGFNPVGAVVWEMLRAAPQTVGALRSAILREFDVDAQRAQADLESFLEKLAETKLVTLEQ